MPQATIKIRKIITTLKMDKVYEISPERQEVTGLGGGFLVGMRTGALTLVEREIYQKSQGRRPGG